MGGAVKTTYAFSAFLTPFPSNFRFAWYQQAGEGGSYDTLVEHYGERMRCFTLTLEWVCLFEPCQIIIPYTVEMIIFA
jgi:hypothetical protein